ncbi:hypothetical protein [uncultured Croceitalea sp.]|uniref:hypothetical protein n=1 Tax=uncultured Croceitalea sp. TaxID=1798908 RepID=UPI00330683F0
MKRIIYFLLFFIGSVAEAVACDLCKEKQPELLKEVAHGAGPEGTIDLLIMWSAVILVGGTLVLSLKFLIFPKEKNPHHIKYLPFDDAN